MSTRTDFFVNNDSGGMSVISAAALQRIIDDQRSDDAAFVRNHEAILLLLHGDDSFPARVVVGGELTEAERDEWLARVTWPLTIDGGLLVAGGFDPRVLEAWRDGEDWIRGGVHAVDAPRGMWLVDLYTHRPTISGRFLDERWPTPLGTWFRRSYPGAPFPGWLARELELSPELDPGHEDEWRESQAAVASGALAIDEDASSAIGYLVHLRPYEEDATHSPMPGGGWFEPEDGERTPAVCPRGLLTDARGEYEKDDVAAAVLERVADVRALVGGELPLLEGEPLRIPLADIDHAFTIAWLMEPLAHPEFRIQTTSRQPPAIDGWHGPTSDDGESWWYRVSLNGTPFGNWSRVRRLATALAADGTITVLELWCARPPVPALDGDGTPPVAGAGTLRLRGAVLDGVWHVGAGMPAHDTGVWRRALAFAAEVSGGAQLTLESAAEADAFAASWRTFDYLLPEPPAEDGMVRTLAEPDPMGLPFLSRRVFAVRFGSVFPCRPESDDEDDEDDDDEDE